MTPHVRVGEVAEQLRGVTYSKDEASTTWRPGYLPVLRAGNITDSGLSFDDLVYVPSNRISPRQRIRPNDVVIAASSGSLDVVGKAAPARSDFEGAFGAFCKVLRPGPAVDPAYFSHFFRTPEYRRTVSSLAAGANINNLRGEHLDDLRIPLPPLDEQRRIAAILDQADELRAKRRAAIAKLDTLTQAIFLDMFTDPEPPGWPVSTIEGVAAGFPGSIRTGPFGSQLLHSEFTAAGIAVLGIDNAVHNEFRWSQRRFISETKYQTLRRYTVRPGDVLITIMGTCGRCAIVPDDIPTAINTKHLCCITLDAAKCLPEFLHSYFLYHPMAQKYLHSKTKGAIMDGLNMGIIREVPIPLVPIELQLSFRAKLAVARRLTASQDRSYRLQDTLFESLQQRAFRGEL